jgi:RNA polymerase sigma factor (sigma-70 family)
MRREAEQVNQKEHFADLVQAVAEQADRTAYAELFDYFAPRVNAYLLRLGAEHALAEEITQDTMVTLWRKAALFDRTKSAVGTWLFRVARNRRIDLIRRDKSAKLDPEEPMLIPEAPQAADEMMDLGQREDMVRGALKVLPAEQLDLVMMSFFNGLSHSQIAEQTGLPLGTVKSRIRLAFARLRRALEDAGLAGGAA